MTDQGILARQLARWAPGMVGTQHNGHLPESQPWWGVGWRWGSGGGRERVEKNLTEGREEWRRDRSHIKRFMPATTPRSLNIRFYLILWSKLPTSVCTDRAMFTDMMETVSEVTERAEWTANRFPMLTQKREEFPGTLQGVLCTLLTRAVGICHGDGIQSRLPQSRSPKTVPEACLPRVFRRRKPDVDGRVKGLDYLPPCPAPLRKESYFTDLNVFDMAKMFILSAISK